ncbi:cation diffusion facilitator family transporter [Pseudonocardia asaccharolytica]|uniref:Cation efflux system protein n=2 Tax=Pseudonocardia asaccharolytica TaxID=54010 RepID=A0A511D975_9PSEU|nr:cation diffusion facilitator family transporter [Pseudonocardia asaccharolytica]GEL20953.1 cation efflux system protein [Pseudonocardia asaccharolytica DSM 44247 = NBRC 16224]
MGDTKHGHGHAHGHRPVGGPWRAVRHLVVPHSHDASERIDSALESSRAGMRALWISLAVLGATAAFQAVVAVTSGSVALLSDTLHNVADALTAVPVGVAFLLGRRPATRRFTYGYGRAEDVAGIIVVLVIIASAVLAGVESLRRLAEPTDMRNIGAVAVAGVVGFLGNEIAAQVRIRTGRRIGSAALVADGLHARTDALTSLAVLLSAGGAAVGWRWADPVVGLLITLAIATVTIGAARQVLARLMDAVDPALVERAAGVLGAVDGVEGVERVRLRWIGHALHAEVTLGVASDLSLVQAHRVAHDAEDALIRGVPRLATATVHAHPRECVTVF